MYQSGVGTANNIVTEFFIEKLAEVQTIYSGGTGTMLTVNDRDWTGTMTDTHSIAGYAAPTINGQNIYQNILQIAGGKENPSRDAAWLGASSGVSTIAPTSILGGLTAVRPDGYYDGNIVIQGVRAYDPNTNQWTTPDAYSGDVTDPMSQKPYMWNGNNPLAYSDPSGYNPGAIALVFDGVEGLACPECLIGTGIGLGIVILKSQHDKADKEADAGVHPAPEAGPGPEAGHSHDETRLPRDGTPGSTVTRGDGKQTRTYGPSGRAIKRH